MALGTPWHCVPGPRGRWILNLSRPSSSVLVDIGSERWKSDIKTTDAEPRQWEITGQQRRPEVWGTPSKGSGYWSVAATL